MRNSKKNQDGAETGAGAPAAPRGRFRRWLRRSTSKRGFILILVVGALSVLTVLGLAFSEQSRADLLGASNGRDLLAADGLAETGFQMALRILAEDRNVWSATTSAGWNMATDGVGHTSRWGYNVNFDLPVDVNQDAALPTASGIQAHTPVPGQFNLATAFNHRTNTTRNYLDSWQMMIWNEEPLNNNGGYAYNFRFDPNGAPPPKYNPKKTWYNQRRPADSRILLDTWSYQPLARVKRFKIRSGLNYGVLQISIEPTDGAININDPFDVGTTKERWGYHDWYNFNGTTNTDLLASPDRRTLDYILGRRPEYSAAHAEYVAYSASLTPARTGESKCPGPTYVANSIFDQFQFVANEPAGSVFIDNGVYNFRGLAEPNGRTYATTAAWPLDNPLPPIAPSSSCYGRLTNINTVEPLIFYNANLITYYRYNFEAPRYPCYVAMEGPSMRYDGGSGRWLTQSGTPNFWETAWWPTGRAWRSPLWSGNDIVDGGAQPTSAGTAIELAPDSLFQGFGFDMNNPKRGGIGAAAGDPAMFTTNDAGEKVYNGAGMYGQPVAHSFQHHFIAAVQQGKFWTDLEANWFFGGSPGYTNKLGRWPDEPTTDQWTYLGSSYDSLGIGTNWMPPTSHVWMPGFFNGTGQIDAYEASCGLLTSPRNMLPTKPAATYTHPLAKFGDDFGEASAHFTYGAQRHMIRAFGLQENWGPANSGNVDNRMYDGININVAPYEVVYGLLTPEKLPSMLNHTVVAPHLHWKSRMLDAAYFKMDTYARYTPDPSGDPTKPSPNFPGCYPTLPYMPKTKSGLPTDYMSPTLPTLPGQVVDYRYGSVNLSGAFVEFEIDDTATLPLAANKTNIALSTPAPRYYCVIGPAPFNYSIHRHYEPEPKAANWTYGSQQNWYPQKYAAGSPGNVGMILNKMDFRTPEPPTTSVVTLTNAANVKPDITADYTLSPNYKMGTGEVQDDVFVDSHYDLSLAPNSTSATDPMPGTPMMCRPYHFTDWPDWFSQRNVTIDQFYKQKSGTVPRDPYQPIWTVLGGGLSGVPSNTVPQSDPPLYNSRPEGAALNYGNWDNGGGIRKIVAIPHRLYGLPNPDYMLQYPGTDPSYHWSDQFRRYFPVAGAPLDDYTTPGSVGKAAYDKDSADGGTSDVALLNKVYKTASNPAGAQYSMAPAPYLKMVDDSSNLGFPFVQPGIPTPKGDATFLKAPFVPGIDKDNAWRITRVGRKYQEIIADEIMDYQVNPWWPNPCAQFTEMSVPLDVQNYPSDTRVPLYVDSGPGSISLNTLNDVKKATNTIFWGSFHKYGQNAPAGTDPFTGDKNVQQGNIWDQVPDYYAYFNRFWVRACHTYARNTSTNFNTRIPDYHCGTPFVSGGAANLVESRGKYPLTYQYMGAFLNDDTGPLNSFWQDNIRDFPENTLEDQLGSEFRYLTSTAKPMFETPPSPGYSASTASTIVMPAAQMSAAPGRNHPFKNWADFVAMLGHLVYRSPITVVHQPTGVDSRDIKISDNRQKRVQNGIRDRILGVNAWQVCHGNFADPRNKDHFFDGSQISAGFSAPAYADALQGYYGYDAAGDKLTTAMGGRGPNEAIVAIDGFWPISGNLGVFNDPSGTVGAGGDPEMLLYPPRPAGMFTDNSGVAGHSADFEWQRRIDEWRGCDAAGLRVEQQYISERAANDVLVSLSNGQIGPIDFDGDGHITMTRKIEIPTESGRDFWPLYPYNQMAGASNVEYIDASAAQAAPGTGFGVLVKPSTLWKQAKNNEIIQNCVTLPIKFRSNTFRVTVAVELTDSKFRNTAAVHKYSRVYSRVTDAPGGNSKVHGPYTGEFILHGNRAIDGVDPEGSWLGADFGTE